MPENFILIALHQGAIVRVVRSYLSRHRAEQDLELLQQISDGGYTYRVDPVPCIED